jgi:hypothetical protein
MGEYRDLQVKARRTKSVVLKPKLYLLIMLGVFTACATHKDHGSTVANATGSDEQCHVATVTGTFTKKKVCSSQADRDAEQRDDDDLEYRTGRGPQGISLQNAGIGH